MRNFSRTFICAAALIAGLSSCNRAVVEGSFDAAPASGNVLVKVQDGNGLAVLDTVKLSADGSFRYRMDMEKGQPEFVYLFCGDVQVASLLLEAASKVNVKCDTIGHWTVSGSDDCTALQENEAAFADFLSDTPITVKKYVDHYRRMVKYVLGNSKSLAVVPVLYQKIGDVPVFGQDTDGVLFGSIADSLATVYPDSKYVKMLRAEARLRQQRMDIAHRIETAEAADYPAVSLPGLQGKEIALSDCIAPKTLIVFWDATDAANKIYNQDVLKPLYRESGKSLGIYAINVGADKATWAMVCREQNLPWTNVCDTRGTSVVLYGVSAAPTVFLLDGKGLTRMDDCSLAALRKALK